MINPGWSRPESPFHQGELAVQARLGVQEHADRQGRRIIREYLTAQHQQFFAQLAYLIIGMVDELDNPWSSVVLGEPGFIEVISDRALQITTQVLTGDPLTSSLKEGSNIGLLGIELHTRRRNRVNGIVSKVNENSLEITLQQAFGNCPQYIQPRTLDIASFRDRQETQTITSLNQVAQDLIANADTFFIATAYQDTEQVITQGVDVSHRGGKPGFVRLDSAQTLTIPDYSGNNHFNTLGNLMLNPRAGLLFIDFATRDLLYLTGTVEIIWSGEEVAAFENAQRLIRFSLQQGIYSH